MGCAPTAPVQAKVPVQELFSSGDAVTAGSSGRNFDREREPVQPAADTRNDRRSLVVQLEATAACGRTLHE